MLRSPADPAIDACPAPWAGNTSFNAETSTVGRVADLVLSFVLLLLSAPLWPLIPLAILAESDGKWLFIQDRVGLDGQTFRMWKFRTMRPIDKVRPIDKLPDDERVTNIGRFLRRTSLDELPQLINVIRGDMSLVGPRPEIVENIERYRVADFGRFQVLPGMTGLWQVSGRSSLSREQKAALDLEYVESRSLWLDLRILLKTPSAVISGRGAY